MKKERPLDASRAVAACIAEQCSDAYSFDRYQNWEAVAYTLLDLGLQGRQTEAVMRSKWMRWAADNCEAPYGKVPAKAIVRFIVAMAQPEIRKLTKETFGVEK